MKPKTTAEFLEHLKAHAPDPGLSPTLKVLWYDGKGDWDAAHDIAQDLPGRNGSHLHAYLHRKEGDRWNAGYWYERAGRPFPKCSLEEEYLQLVALFIS